MIRADQHDLAHAPIGGERRAEHALGRCPAPILVMMLSAVLLQRIAVPGTGGIVGVGLVIGLAGFAWALLSGRLVVHPLRLALYCLALSGLLASLVGQTRSFSAPSFAMLAAIYLPFVAVLALRLDEWFGVLVAFRALATFVAVLGLAQFGIQFVLGPAAMFPFDAVLGPQWFVTQFNLKIPLWQGSPWLKSTGLVFLEPSHFAQTLAFAVLVEVTYFASPLRLLLYGAAYLVSFSGTGLVLLAVLGLPLLVRSRAAWSVAIAGSLGAVLVLLADVPIFDPFIERTGEFANPLSSGYMRFLAPYRFVEDKVLVDPLPLLFGHGPGNFEEIGRGTDYAVLDTMWLKLLVEYGLVGLLAFAPFYLYVLFVGSPDRLVSTAFLLQIAFLGGYLNSYYVQFLLLALVGWPRLQPEQASLGREDAARSDESIVQQGDTR